MMVLLYSGAVILTSGTIRLLKVMRLMFKRNALLKVFRRDINSD